MKISTRELNLKAVKIIKSIKILERISWPTSLEQKFLKAPKKQTLSKLKFQYPKKDFSEEKQQLKKILSQLSYEDPLQIYTRNTIESYLLAIELVHSVGSQEFKQLSIELYGLPSHKLFGSKYSHLKTAQNFLTSFKDYDHPYLNQETHLYNSNQFKEFLQIEAHKLLGEDSPTVKLSQKMMARASAGRSYVKIRKNAGFTRLDFKQLLIHEVFTHTLTAINGLNQYHLPLLGHGAPRTTKTQEGLATFSEVITGLLDLNRLKRLSLRVIAIDMALDGADLFDLYTFFREHDQDKKESFLSASRILRGGHPAGGIVFTKDAVYLEGLIRVHSFFRWAFKTRNLDLVHMLFCGRLDINDIFLLKESYHLGLINIPKYLPDWYQSIDQLAGKMAFSLILNGINLDQVENYYNSKFQYKKAS